MEIGTQIGKGEPSGKYFAT